jgi:hypothetical protein
VNFNVYLDDPTVERLNKLARRQSTTRNALIREAVGQFLAQQGPQGWPEAVMAFDGAPDVQPFEAPRKALKAPRKDPLR